MQNSLKFRTNYSAQMKQIEHRLRLIALETKNEHHKRTLKMAAEIIEGISTIKKAHKQDMVIVDRIAAKVDKPPTARIYVHMSEDKIRTAYQLMEHVDSRRMLYRWPNGRMRMLREFSKAPPNAEFLGLFDEGVTVSDLIEAIS